MSLPITADPGKDMGDVIRYLRPTPPASAKYTTAKGEKTGPWRKSEDFILERWVEKKGPADWVGAALLIPGRTSKQCRERWHQNLNPALNHDPICEDEGNIIVEMVQQKGKKWAEIAREMRNNRSDNAIKNYWNGWNNCRKRQQRSASTSVASASSSVPYPPHSHRHGAHFAAPEPSLPTYAYPRSASYQQPQHHLSAQSHHHSAQESSTQQRHLYHSHHLHSQTSQVSTQRQILRPPPQPAPGRPSVAMIASPASSTPSTEMGSTRLASCSPIERTLGEFTPSPRSSVTEPASFTTSRRSSLGITRIWQGGPAPQNVPRTPQTDVWQHRLAAPTNSGAVMIGSPQWHQHGSESQTQPQHHADRPNSESNTSLQNPISSKLPLSEAGALLFHSHQMPRALPPSRRKQEDLVATSPRLSGPMHGDHDAKRRKISVAAICN